MSANVWPVDAVAGAPSYTGRTLRQLVGLSWARNPSRPLGAVTGVVVGTPTTIATATSTTWTVTPFGGVIDGETSAVAGAYNYSFDANVTGAVTAANASNPRIDLLYVQVSDPAEGDGSSVPAISLLYLAGTAAASPVAPSTPARSMALVTILVPKVGAGSPSVSWAARFTSAAGGIATAASSGLYPANPYVGQYVDDATLGLLRWTGSAWAAAGGDTGWTTLPLNSPTVVSGGVTPMARIRNGQLIVVGNVSPNTGTFAAGATINAVHSTVFIPPGTSTAMGKILAGNGTNIAHGFINGTGQFQLIIGANPMSVVNLDGLSGYLMVP